MAILLQRQCCRGTDDTRSNYCYRYFRHVTGKFFMTHKKPSLGKANRACKRLTVKFEELSMIGEDGAPGLDNALLHRGSSTGPQVLRRTNTSCWST